MAKISNRNFICKSVFKTDLTHGRAEIYALKMKLDQEKSKRGDQKVEKKEPKMIVEMLKFDKEEKKEEIIKNEEHPFVLKEVKTS